MTADGDDRARDFDEADYPLAPEEERAIASLTHATLALRKVRAVSRRRFDEIKRLREELAAGRAVARDLLSAWQAADEAWMQEMGEREEGWAPKNSALVARAQAFVAAEAGADHRGAGPHCSSAQD